MSEQGDQWEERDQQDQGARSSRQGTGESDQGGTEEGNRELGSGPGTPGHGSGQNG